MNHQAEVQRADSILRRIAPLKRLDKAVGIGNLAIEAGVSLVAFEEALQRTDHPRDGVHVYFGLKSIRAAVKAQEQDELQGVDSHCTEELSQLMGRAGRSLRDIAKPRQVKPLKTTGKLSFRFTQDESHALQHALSLTGKPNVSAQVKACVEAYPRMREIEQGYFTLGREIEKLKQTVDTLPSLILKLAAK